ncbi:tyrosine-protein kinase family protein [Actinokineospora bangkokensis]|uniref:Uncharacterized protein n=1 Tax=Actinokineospora bangkokensis TaxID=1193682 RepID=A0A1Q9LQP2_9PSEU|nr:TIR domain-containing protein [Actinokineospora bangkokensis]OLR94349.1 hypothetical protein BJP25_11320 [Actinokineospora bangkokensis]
MPGSVITFYSFKGGVGRSFTLANVALLLARWGYSVLCVDWDLEAPGLNYYFQDMLSSPPESGVIDLVDDFTTDPDGPLVDRTISLIGVGALDLLAAGRADARYSERVQAADWDGLYKRRFGDFLERHRDAWLARYDYVLIDSRTGVSDTGGICTAQLPDRLVLVTVPNMQSIRGVVDIATRAAAARDGLPYDRSRLSALPVLSRLDTNELERAESWHRRFLEEALPLYRNWLDVGVSAEVVSRLTTVPYSAYWSLGEQLPAAAETEPTPDQITYPLETIAALVAQGFDRTDLLGENRDAYVTRVRERNREFSHEVLVSANRPTMELAETLAKALAERGVRAERSLSGDRSLIPRAEAEARHLCLVVDGKLTRWQEAEVELFLHRTIGQDRRVIPILTETANPEELPGFIANLRYVRMSQSRGADEVAKAVVDQVLKRVPLVDQGDADFPGLLAKVSAARLPEALWALIDELVGELLSVVGSGDAVLAAEIADEIAAVITPRPRRSTVPRTPAPRDTVGAIEWAIRVLNARVINKRE